MTGPSLGDQFNAFLDREMSERRKEDFRKLDDEKYKIPPKGKQKRRKLCFRQFFHA